MKAVDATFPVHGMTCSGCSTNLTKILFALPGMLYVGVELNNKSATVRFDADKITLEKIESAIRDAGFTTNA